MKKSSAAVPMLLPVLLLFASSRHGFRDPTSETYAEVTSEVEPDIIGGARPVLVKFYSRSCPHCRSMAPDFVDASQWFRQQVLFAGVECTDEPELCKKHVVPNVPYIKFFNASSTTGIVYDGERDADGFADFVEKQTGFKSIRPPKVLVEFNPVSLYEVANRTHCVFVTFYAPWCGHCKKFLPQENAVSLAMQPDIAKVVLGKLNCVEYGEFCEPFVPGYPTVILFKDGGNITYESFKSATPVIEFINEQCGTERGLDGLLDDNAGTIPEANELVRQFILADNETKPSFLDKMKQISGAQYYVTVMDRYLSKGVDQIWKDRRAMNKVLDERNGAWPTLDGMKRRLNVLVHYLLPPNPHTPSPTPSPTYETIEMEGTTPPTADVTELDTKEGDAPKDAPQPPEVQEPAKEAPGEAAANEPPAEL